MSDHGEQFENADAGSSLTFPQEAGLVRKGSHLMIKGHPCKCNEVSTSKTGKHGHAKAHIVATDIFTGKKYEDLCPCSHNLDVPFVKRTEYTVLSVNDDDDTISLLTEGGTTKDDLNLPHIVIQGTATEEDNKISAEIKSELEKGDKTVLVIVQGACAMEKIVGVKLT